MTNPIDQDVMVKIRERIASFIMTQVINPKGEFQCDNPGLNYNWTKMSIVLWNNNQGPAGYKTCRIRNMMCSSVYVLSLILYKMMMMNMMCCSCTMYDEDEHDVLFLYYVWWWWTWCAVLVLCMMMMMMCICQFCGVSALMHVLPMSFWTCEQQKKTQTRLN